MDAAPLSLLYRGRLSSCNYACAYCPFAKHQDSRATLARDAADLARFVAWVAEQNRPLRLLFTPYGEALVRRHYRDALLRLAALPHVLQAAVQTNLSAPLSWLEHAPPGKIALCCTFHPSQTTPERFLKRCARLRDLGISFSVGVVALHEHYPAIRALRAALPPAVYLWLNAYDQRGANYYAAADLLWLDAIDPWFHLNRQPPGAKGQACRTGLDVLSVDGAGELRRCHFLPQRLGNLYRDDLAGLLQARPCPRARCGCYIGHAHREDLPFYADFGIGVLARIPAA